MTHIWISKLTIIGSDNGLSPSRHPVIIWTNAWILLIWPSGINFSEILIEIDVFSFKKMHMKMPSATFRPFCLVLNVLRFPVVTGWHHVGSHRYLQARRFMVQFQRHEKSIITNGHSPLMAFVGGVHAEFIIIDAFKHTAFHFLCNYNRKLMFLLRNDSDDAQHPEIKLNTLKWRIL